MKDIFENFKNLVPDFVKTEEEFELLKIRHTTEHIFNHAVERLWPGKTKRALAHLSSDGFSTDSRWESKISDDDLIKIEEEMKKIVKENLKLRREELPIEKAKQLFKDNPFKLEWIDQFSKEGKTITVYWTGDEFVDLCKGPHVDYTSKVKVFKLLNIAGAYWRGDEKNEMLTRVYGTAFKKKEDLDKYLWQIDEAKKRDHRILGKKLDLFTFSDLVGPGLPLFTQNGALIRRQLTQYVEELQSKEGYMQVWTPQIGKGELYKISGHYDKYHEDMFIVKSHYSDDEYFLKPMNCPHHTQIFKSQLRSYRDLPIRMTDFAMLYRDERPGELGGLARVRSFSTDDCHVFCREDQVDEEIDRALQMTKKIMETFGFKYRYRMSIRDPKTPEKYLGDPKVWDKLENWAVEIMKRNNIEYYDGPGEASFYAPKMDLMATDALGREWQLSTVQIDYVMPQRFGLTYKDKDGLEKTPVMIHRAILGSAERAMMVLIEHFAGKFPAWLSPEQIRIIPISDANNEFANNLKKELEEKNIRVSVDDDSERMQNKIRKAQEMKIPYMVIIGNREQEEGKVAVRFRDSNETKQFSVQEFIEKIANNVSSRAISTEL